MSQLDTLFLLHESVKRLVRQFTRVSVPVSLEKNPKGFERLV